MNLFLGRPVLGEVFLERIPFDAIPNDMDVCSKWLVKEFVKKVLPEMYILPQNPLIQNGVQDKLMEEYEQNGVFPTSLTENDGNYFNGPIRCHYRPRSFWPFLLFCLWTCVCLPVLFNGLKWILGTGVISLLAGICILGIGKNESMKMKKRKMQIIN